MMHVLGITPLKKKKKIKNHRRQRTMKNGFSQESTRFIDLLSASHVRVNPSICSKSANHCYGADKVSWT